MIIYILSVLILFFVGFRSFWCLPSRFSVAIKTMYTGLCSNFTISPKRPVFYLLIVIFIILLGINLLCNLPFSCSPTLYYWFTSLLSFSIWLSLVSVALHVSYSAFILHLIPYGAPMFLSPLLPLVELFSQIIRPLTLIIRLRTNLSAGHIIIYIFSFFSTIILGSSVLAILIFSLMVIEISISVLQAYIFTSLFTIYYRETI